MEDILNFDIVTTPGVVAYEQGSEEMAVLFVLSIIAEGYKEEPKYLKCIRNICEQKGAAQIVIHLINRQYKRKKDSVGRNHPMNRLEDLLEWKTNHLPVEGIENRDEYWLICDRDNDSFTAEQYDSIVEECEKSGVNLIVSNPAFQIWLLLHFTSDLSSCNFEQYEKSAECVKKGVEPVIKRFDSNYKHGRINVKNYAPYIRAAMNNSEHYCFNVMELKTSIGTNFRDLLTRIEDVSGKEIF